jgi:hypothetical protein
MHWVARKRLGRLEVVKGQRRRPVAIKAIEALVGRRDAVLGTHR